MPRLSWGDSRRGIFTWMCWKRYLFHCALLCHIDFVFTFLCFFFRYWYQFSSLSGVSILGGAIVAIAESGWILIRTTVVYYILFAPPSLSFCQEANKASVLSSHPSSLVVAYFICAGYTRSYNRKNKFLNLEKINRTKFDLCGRTDRTLMIFSLLC